MSSRHGRDVTGSSYAAKNQPRFKMPRIAICVQILSCFWRKRACSDPFVPDSGLAR
jgi:hypothetical protein